MSDEIKEILDYLSIKSSYKHLSFEASKALLDYITNLQQENENLKEDNWVYHQLLRAGNKREYRSKFLKDFQKEYGKNVFPDYDEIYKRYDDYKSRIEKAFKKVKDLYSYADNEEYVDNYCKDLLNILQGEDNE